MSWIAILHCNCFFLSVHARGIGYMQNMRAFKTVCPLRNELHLDITTAVKVTMGVQLKQERLCHVVAARSQRPTSAPRWNQIKGIWWEMFGCLCPQKGAAEWYESLIAQHKPEEGVSFEGRAIPATFFSRVEDFGCYSPCFDHADSGGAAEKNGSRYRCRVHRRTKGSEHLQQALLQVRINSPCTLYASRNATGRIKAVLPAAATFERLVRCFDALSSFLPTVLWK